MKKKHKKNKEEKNLAIWIAIIILTLFIIYENISTNKVEKEPNLPQNKLIDILKFEISNSREYFKIKNITPNCYDYMVYYNQSLKKYDELDVRVQRYVDICNNLTLCDNYHTYLVVNGYGMEFILDGEKYAGISIINIENEIQR